MARATRAERIHELSELADVMALCRAQGILSFEKTAEGYKMLFGPLPVPKGKEVKDDPRAPKRALYLDQLGRTLTDAELDMLP